MVWSRTDGTNYRIQARFRAADGTFSPPRRSPTSGRDAFEPQVAFDPSGNAIAVWTQWDGANSRIYAAFRPAGGSFGAGQAISASGRRSERAADLHRLDRQGCRRLVPLRRRGRPGPGRAASRERELRDRRDALRCRASSPTSRTSRRARIRRERCGRVDRHRDTESRVQAARRQDYVGYPPPAGGQPRPSTRSYLRTTSARRPARTASTARLSPASSRRATRRRRLLLSLTVGTSRRESVLAVRHSSVSWVTLAARPRRSGDGRQRGRRRGNPPRS